MLFYAVIFPPEYLSFLLSPFQQSYLCLQILLLLSCMALLNILSYRFFSNIFRLDMEEGSAVDEFTCYQQGILIKVIS